MLMVAWSVVRLIYWMLVVPYLIGQLFNFILPEGKKTIGITFILGFLIYIAIFAVSHYDSVAIANICTIFKIHIGKTIRTFSVVDYNKHEII